MREDLYLPALNEKIGRDGYVIAPFIDIDIVNQLRSFYYSQDHLKASGTHVTMFNPDDTYRKKIDATIKSLCAPLAENMMPGYRVLYTNFMIKESGPEGDFPLHQDWTYVDESKFSSYAFWIPLQDVHHENGTLNMVKGSHQFITQLRGPYVHEPFQKLSTIIKNKYSEPVKLKAGEALIWDHRLLHFSLPNKTPHPRLAITLIMVPIATDIIHCFGIDQNGGKTIQKYKVDTDFFMNYQISKAPHGVPMIEEVEQEHISFSAEDFEKLFTKANLNDR